MTLIKNNKRKMVLCLLFLLCIVSISILFCINRNMANANEDVSLSTSIEANYVRNDKFVVPTATVLVSGTQKEMSHVLRFPNGNTATSNEVMLSEIGQYHLEYKLDSITKEYTFNVENGMSSLFSASNNVIIENDVELPDYFEPTSEYGASTDRGVKFTIESGSSATIYYNNVIDLNKLNFSNTDSNQTLAGNFVEWLVTPQDNTAKEFSHMTITLTDIYDTNNYITIELLAGDVQSVYPNNMYCKSSACGLYKPMGFLIGSDIFSNAGTAVQTSFYGSSGSSAITSTGRLFFDNNNLELWAGPVQHGSIRNLGVMTAYKDASVVGVNNVWSGFTTGEVYFEMTVDQIHLSNASFMLLNIGGNNLSNDYNKQSTTKISLNYGSFDSSKLYIVAGEDKYCPVFDAVAYSETSGILENVKTNVYFGENKDQVIPVIDGKFLVEQVGKYWIEYVVDSPFGYAVKQISIEARDSFNAEDVLKYSLNETIVDTAIVGDSVYLYDGVVEGGLGNLRYEYSVLFNDGVNTETIDLITSDFIPYFRVDKIGTYTITISVFDELNQSVKKTKTISITEDLVPNIFVPTMPYRFLNGQSYYLPKATASFYKNGTNQDVEVYTYVNGVNYTKRAYTVSGDFTITYKAEVKNDVNIYAEKTVPCTATDKLVGSNYLKSFFVSDGGSISIDSNGIIFSAESNTNSLKFINKIYDGQISLSFSPYYDSNLVYQDNNYDSIDVILSDSVNKSEQVKLSFKNVLLNGKNYASIFINDKFSSFCAGAFDGSSKDLFTINYNNRSYVITDYSNKNVGIIEKYSNGNSFKGFTSQYVYVDISLSNAEVGSKCRVVSFGSQRFSSDITTDNVAPTIFYSKDLASYNTTIINEEFVVPAAIATDYLSSIEYLTVKITSPTGKVVYEGSIDKDKSIKFDEYGRYVVVFEAKDSTCTRKNTKSYYVFTQEYQAPEITLSNELVSTAKVYEEYSIAKIDIKDSSEYTKVCYAISPTYEYIAINGDFVVFDKEGTYKICYYVFDEFYNFSIVSYEVEVSI